MNRWAQPLLAILFLFMVVEVLLIAPRDVEKVGEPEITLQNDLDSGPEVEQSMTGIRVTGTRDETKEWQLWADQAFDYRQEEKWTLKKVRVIFFGQGGTSFEVIGDQGSVDLLSKDMRIEGNVVTTSSNGYVFRTDEMTYNSLDKQLTSDSKVFMTGPNDKKGRHMSLSGIGVLAKLKDSLIEIRGNVQAQKPLEKGKNLVLMSNTAMFSGQSNLAKFQGNVRMEMDGMKISGPEAVFNYDRERGEVVAVDVLGGVRVSDLDKWATAQKLNVQLDSRKIVFTGSPRVVQNDDELRGEEIVFHNGGEQVEVRRARARVEKKTLETM